MSKQQPTEIRLSISNTSEAIQFWLNNYLLKEEVIVDEVVFEPRDQHFRVILKEDK